MNPIWTQFWAQVSGRVGPQDQKTGPIRSGWLQIGFEFGFNPIMYLINPNEPDCNPLLGRVGPPGSKFGLSRVGWVGSDWSGLFGRTKFYSFDLPSQTYRSSVGSVSCLDTQNHVWKKEKNTTTRSRPLSTSCLCNQTVKEFLRRFDLMENSFLISSSFDCTYSYFYQFLS